MWSYCGHFQIHRGFWLLDWIKHCLIWLVIEMNHTSSHASFWCLILATSLAIHHSNIGVWLRKVTTLSPHTLPWVRMDNLFYLVVLFYWILTRTQFIWQVAWPLELIIDSNAIKKYNQVTYLHMVFSLKLHSCLHSPEFLLTSLRSQKCFLFVTTVLNSRAILLWETKSTWCYCLLTSISCPFSLHSLMEISPSRNPSFLGLWLSAMKAS
jgi:hypothetical protein